MRPAGRALGRAERTPDLVVAEAVAVPETTAARSFGGRPSVNGASSSNAGRASRPDRAPAARSVGLRLPDVVERDRVAIVRIQARR